VQYARKLQQVLASLNVSQEPGDMNLPGFRLHPLKGERKGQWAVSITGNLRIVFEFEGENATNVDLVDYH
jgi:proteic killer suppression protein